MTSITINGAFRPQRITGQQRYATEIADRVLAAAHVREAVPAGAWSGSAAREWAWTLLRLPSMARGSTLLSLTSRAPVGMSQVLAVHDLFVLTHPEWYSRRYVMTHAPALRAQLASAAAVVAVSEPTAEDVAHHYDGEVVVAPNAPSAVFADPSRADHAILDRLGVRRDGYLLTVGSMDPRKNLARLAHAFGTLPAATRSAFPLVVVGASATIYRDAGLTWPEGVRSAGYVTDEELAALYRGSRAVVFPSQAEGFGLPLVEAAAAGATGVVISDLPVFRWICGDGAAYVDPSSIASIAQGLERAIENGVPAMDVDLERFDWDASAATVSAACDRAPAVAP
ncbi:glycosyltransferase family 4 protein [Demequina activiva]|uniref:Glycosyl transferase family 1 domain-containing protein n=1 Tax=Demequina activiva TaxID=1582364 RepID=A0A919UJ58_9MICO|nr:glycosyltransferase family 1 protein [Demequina activiva]GIG53425.1 hypothetical protein Dac01nite_01770 [Demequina activiva]